MINWLKRKLFWEPPLPPLPETEAQIRLRKTRTEERRLQLELDEQRRVEQRAIQIELGISSVDDVQAWLRLHQLLKSHEDRITALEAKGRRRTKA